MKSTSSERVVLRGAEADLAPALGTGTDLRRGGWTRLGDANVLGDKVTEATLATLADRAEQAARAQGFAAGWAEGRRKATESLAAQHAEQAQVLAADRARVLEAQQAATLALAAAADQVGASLAETQQLLAAQAVELALQIAAAVVQHDVLTATDPGADAVLRALGSVPPGLPVTVRLHPVDRAQLDLTLLEGRSVVVVDDPTLARGDAIAETESQIVDARLSVALDRVREVLLP